MNIDKEIAQIKWETNQLLREAAQIRRDSDAESAKRKREVDAEIAQMRRESEAESAQRKREMDAKSAKTNREIDAVKKEIIAINEKTAAIKAETAAIEKSSAGLRKEWGGYTDSEGEIIEDEFIAGIEEKKQIGDIHLTEVLPRVKSRQEFDFVGLNGQAVIIGEVKRNVTVRDVHEFVAKVSQHFADEFPKLMRPKVYGLVAGKLIAPAAKRAANNHGLFIVQFKNKQIVVDKTAHAKPLHLSPH